MKFVAVVVGCTLLSTPAWAGQPGTPASVIVESTTPETVIVESTTPETVVARRFGPRRAQASSAAEAGTVPWLVWFDWSSTWGRMLQLLLR